MDSSDDIKNGRPLKIKTLGELQTRISGYFSYCDPHIEEVVDLRDTMKNGQQSYMKKIITEQQPYTVTDLALALGIARQTLLNYSNGKLGIDNIPEDDRQEFMDTIKEAKQKCEAFAERKLFGGSAPAGVIFNLKNNHGWIDESRVISSVKDDLDDLEDGDSETPSVAGGMAELGKATTEILKGGNDGEGSPAGEQNVAADSPVQNQE